MKLIDQLEAMINDPDAIDALQRRKELRAKLREVEDELREIAMRLAPKTLRRNRPDSFSAMIRAVLTEEPMTQHGIHARLLHRGFTGSSPARVQKILSAWKSVGKVTNNNGVWSLTSNTKEAK